MITFGLPKSALWKIPNFIARNTEIAEHNYEKIISNMTEIYKTKNAYAIFLSMHHDNCQRSRNLALAKL